MFEADVRRFEFLRMYCEASVFAVVGMSVVVLCGWAFHIEILKSVLPGLVTMKANTAIGTAVSATSLCLLLPGESRTRRGRIARILALLVVLMGTATLSEYVFHMNLGIDQLLVNDFKGSLGTSSPGRPAPTTATALMAIGLALILLDWKTERGYRPAQLLSLWAALIALMAISGYIYQATVVSKLFLYTQVAVHTAIALFLLSSAVFFARPSDGIARDLTSHASGSAMARRLLPAVFFIPLLLGWICLQGQISGVFGKELGLALYASVTTVVFAVLVWLTARQMNREYDQRSQAEVGIRKLNAELEQRVIERTKTLEQLAERLSLATAIAKVGVWDWDLASNGSTWDATMFEIYGFPPVVPMLYEKWAAAVHPEDLLLVEANLKRTIQEKSQGSAEFRMILPDGTQRDISVIQKVVLDEQANVSRLIGVNMDITERKRAEAAREQSGKDQIRFKDEFLSHVSHELRSPLTAIKQFTTILLGGLAGDLNKEQREYQQIVLKNIRQLQSMIDDLLEITRLETGKLNVERESVSVLEALTDSFNTLQVNARAKGVNLICSPPPDLPLAHADHTRIRQILIILIDNAIKFTPAGGTVRIQARLLERDRQFLLFEVSDTGCGITPEVSERIFERLYQVDEPTQASRKGLGLGLFICKELVTRQGGQIWVESRPQEGSTFSFTLPVFSLSTSIAPLLKDDQWPAESVALLMVETCFLGVWPSKGAEEEWSKEVRSLVERCLLPNLDVLLPKMSYGEEGERFFVAAFANERGVSTLADRIRAQFEHLLRPKRAGLTLSVSYTMLKPFPPDEGATVENIVTSMAKKLEESIKSQILSEVTNHE